MDFDQSRSVSLLASRTLWAMRIALLAMTILAYGPIWNNDFIDFDDEFLLIGNPHVMGGLTLANFSWAFTNHEAPYSMPVVWLSFQLDAIVHSTSEAQALKHSTLSPAMFHGQNLFWHLCNVQLLFALLHHLTAKPWRCLMVAAIFGVHPMHVESVAWAIERKDVMMCFFGLVSVWAYVRYVERRSWLAYLGMLLAFLLSLLCKPMLLTFPFVLLLLDYWPLGRLQLRMPSGGLRVPLAENNLEANPRPVLIGWLFLEKIPVLIVALLLGMHAVNSQPVSAMTDLSLFDQAMNAWSGYESYLYKTAYPVGLGIFYPHPGGNWSLFKCLAGAGLILFGSALSLVLAKRCRWLPVGWFWFVGTLLPVIGLAQGGYQAWADRFSYWPHIGLFIVIVWGTTGLARGLHCPTRVLACVSLVVLVSLMELTRIQVGYWESSMTIWQHTLDVTEDNDRAHEHVAVALRRQGRVEESKSHLLDAVRIQQERRRLRLH